MKIEYGEVQGKEIKTYSEAELKYGTIYVCTAGHITFPRNIVLAVKPDGLPVQAISLETGLGGYSSYRFAQCFAKLVVEPESDAK